MPFAVGDKVIAPRLQTHATVMELHVSYRVTRGTDEIVIGEDEVVPGVTGDPLETYTSYLIEREWDAIQLWVTEDDLEPEPVA